MNPAHIYAGLQVIAELSDLLSAYQAGDMTEQDLKREWKSTLRTIDNANRLWEEAAG